MLGKRGKDVDGGITDICRVIVKDGKDLKESDSIGESTMMA